MRGDCRFHDLPHCGARVVALFLPLACDGLLQRLACDAIPAPDIVEPDLLAALTDRSVPLLARVEWRIEVDQVDALGVQTAQHAQIVERVDHRRGAVQLRHTHALSQPVGLRQATLLAERNERQPSVDWQSLASLSYNPLIFRKMLLALLDNPNLTSPPSDPLWNQPHC